MTVAAVKAQVEQRIGVPTCEQRLFLEDGAELGSDVGFPSDAGLTRQGLILLRAATDPRQTDLGHFWPTEGSTFEALPKGRFAVVKKLGSGIHGGVFSYRCRRVGCKPQMVAVKKFDQEQLRCIRETERDERKAHFGQSTRRAPCAEDSLAEVGVLQYLAKQRDLPLYLIRMQGLFAWCKTAWLVTEFADGGDMFCKISREGPLAPELARVYSWQMLQAVAYLHKHRIGHRDISLENLLLHGGSVRVMDFGLAACCATSSGVTLRFFRCVGKEIYRAPECYVPSVPEVSVVAPEDVAPGDIVSAVHEHCSIEVRLPKDAEPGQACRNAEVWGYALAPADLFSAGVCVWIMMTGTSPWNRADFLDVLFQFVSEHGMAEVLRKWGMPQLPEAAQAVVDTMTRLRPGYRPSAAACLLDPWFEGLWDLQVPTQ